MYNLNLVAMKKMFLIIGLVSGIAFYMPTKQVQAQCPNLDFSSKTMENWRCYAGSCSGGNYIITPVTQIPWRVSIMDAEQLLADNMLYDENCPKIPKVPEGHRFSCRIGNKSAGSEVDAIEYEMTVDSSSSLLLLSFAYVMENPGHNLSDQPQFTMKIKDSL